MCFLGFSKSLPYTSHNHHFDYEMENCRYLASPGVLDARFGCTPYKVEAEASGLLTPTRTGWDPTGWFFPGKAGAVAIVARGLCTFAQKAGDLVEQFRLHRSLSREFYIYIYMYTIYKTVDDSWLIIIVLLWDEAWHFERWKAFRALLISFTSIPELRNQRSPHLAGANGESCRSGWNRRESADFR